MAASRFLNSSAFAVASGIHKKNSFFLTVVSWASKRYGILAWRLRFGLPGQKCRIIQKNSEKIGCNLNISDQHVIISIIVTKRGFKVNC